MQVTAQQAAKLWSHRDNIYADVIAEINGSNVTTHKKLPASEITEETLLEFKDSYQSKKITLKAYSKNGNAWKFENEFEVSFSTPIESRSMSRSMSGFEEEQEEDFDTTPTYSNPVSAIPANGNLGLFQYIATSKEQEAADLKRRNERLERDNERLKQKLADVEFELKIKDKEHELAIDRKEAESKNSLSGLIEQAAKPEIMQHLPALIGALKGVPTQMGALPEGDQFAGLADDHSSTLKHLTNYLKTSPEMTAQTYAIVDTAAKVPGLMNKFLNQIQKYQSNEQ